MQQKFKNKKIKVSNTEKKKFIDKMESAGAPIITKPVDKDKKVSN